MTPASWIVSVATRYSRNARARRAQMLADHIQLKPEDVVLDLGGGTGDHFHSVLPDHKHVVIADVSETDLALARQRYGYRTVQLPDGSVKLPFKTQEFDFVFCSSVIEHVTGPKQEVEWIADGTKFDAIAQMHQWAFAHEIRRVAKRYYVQTPYRYFLIESHSWLPGIIVFLPRPLLVLLLRFTNMFWPKKTAPDWRLLTIGEFSEMFPCAIIAREKSLGLIKSLVAIKAGE